jgi:hypothetical protein
MKAANSVSDTPTKCKYVEKTVTYKRYEDTRDLGRRRILSSEI